VPIAFTAKDYGQDASEDISPTLRSGGHADSHANGGVMPAVAYGFQPRIARNGRGDMGDVINALTAEAGTTGKGDAAPCVAYAIQENLIHHEVIPFDTTQLTHPENRSNPQPGDPCHPLAAAGHAPSICGSNMAVRRLMPVECERLQGFPDNWTRIPVKFFTTKQVSKLRPEDMWEVGFGPNGRPGWWLMAADGPRYKQCGNSMARNCMAWIGWRIKGWLQLEPFRELIG
jgi:DNA (cytosine-5)-methyltransferase 1